MKCYGHDANKEIKYHLQGYLDVVKVNLMAPCEEKPYMGMDEACEYIHYTKKNPPTIINTFTYKKSLIKLFINQQFCLCLILIIINVINLILLVDKITIHDSEDASLESLSIWGILRGLESISQLMVTIEDNISVNHYLIL